MEHNEHEHEAALQRNPFFRFCLHINSFLLSKLNTTTSISAFIEKCTWDIHCDTDIVYCGSSRKIFYSL